MVPGGGLRALVGLQVQVLNADTSHEIDAVLATNCARAARHFQRTKPLPLPAGVSNWSNWRHATRSPRHTRGANMSKSGGLMSYGANVASGVRQLGGVLCRPHPQGREASGLLCRRRSLSSVSTSRPPTPRPDVPPLLVRADEVIE